MKKLSVSIILSVLASMPILAETVSETAARRIADIFMETDRTTRTVGRNLELVWNGLDNIQTKADAGFQESAPAPFYIFNRQNGGFVIVAGDDRELPILAYSADNCFSRSGMPDNVEAWIGRMISHMENVMNGSVQGNGNAGQWQKIESITKALGGTQKVLATALWNQDEPFNEYCTTICGERVLTGCSATAAAILMRYHRYPSQAHGPIPGYTSSNRFIIPDNDDLPIYDWNNMPLSSPGSWSNEQKAQVSRLMYDCGMAFKSDYGSTGTGAYNSALFKGMTTYFKFSKKARMTERANFGLEEWLGILRKEIDANTPVIYTGQSIDNGGHAFIIDGYDSNGYLHVNWGWGGSNNGFYAMTDVEYNRNDIAMTGLVPDEYWSTDNIATLSIRNESGNFISDTPYIVPGEEFKVAFAILNDGSEPYSGQVCLKHFRKDGTAKEVLFDTNMEIGVRDVISAQLDKLKITGTIEDGDYLAWTYNTIYGEVEIRNNRFCRIPLRYSLAQAVGLSYSKTGREITLEGLSGMTCTFQKREYTFPFDDNSNGNILTIEVQEGEGTFPLTISNGNETLTVNITF